MFYIKKNGLMINPTSIKKNVYDPSATTSLKWSRCNSFRIKENGDWRHFYYAPRLKWLDSKVSTTGSSGNAYYRKYEYTVDFSDNPKTLFECYRSSNYSRTYSVLYGQVANNYPCKAGSIISCTVKGVYNSTGFDTTPTASGYCYFASDYQASSTGITEKSPYITLFSWSASGSSSQTKTETVNRTLETDFDTFFIIFRLSGDSSNIKLMLTDLTINGVLIRDQFNYDYSGASYQIYEFNT